MQFLFFKNYQNHLLLMSTLAAFIPHLAMQIHFRNGNSEKENFTILSNDPCTDYINNASATFVLVILFFYMLSNYTDCFTPNYIILIGLFLIMYGIFLYFRIKSLNRDLGIAILIVLFAATVFILSLFFIAWKRKDEPDYRISPNFSLIRLGG